MSNSAIAAQLLQKLSHLLEANKSYKSIQAEAYVVTTKAQTNGQVGGLLNPCWIDHQSQGHREVPDDIFKLAEDFSSLTLSALQDVQNLQCEDDPTTRQKLVAGLERADRVAAEIAAGSQEAFKKAKYYSEVWGRKTAQWEHEAKLQKIWDENPGLPLFAAGDILRSQQQGCQATDRTYQSTSSTYHSAGGQGLRNSDLTKNRDAMGNIYLTRPDGSVFDGHDPY